jgi:hypothetical protein
MDLLRTLSPDGRVVVKWVLYADQESREYPLRQRLSTTRAPKTRGYQALSKGFWMKKWRISAL